MKALVLLFIRIHYLLNLRGIKIKGLGYVQRFLKNEFVFIFQGKKFYYAPLIEGSYDYILIDKSNEPETQLFLSKILPVLNMSNFIDVGASVGEFVISACKQPGVRQIFAFEPRPECAYVLKKNAELNNENKIMVYQFALSDIKENIDFHLNPGGTSSGLYSNSMSEKIINIQTTTLDSILPRTLNNAIILVDVEGAEPKVLRGGINFIRNNNPLIIFEFNNISKQHFGLPEIEGLLGESYSIYRLRGDGDLDLDFHNSWNCVAIPANSVFSDILESSIKNIV